MELDEYEQYFYNRYSSSTENEMKWSVIWKVAAILILPVFHILVGDVIIESILIFVSIYLTRNPRIRNLDKLKRGSAYPNEEQIFAPMDTSFLDLPAIYTQEKRAITDVVCDPLYVARIQLAPTRIRNFKVELPWVKFRRNGRVVHGVFFCIVPITPAAPSGSTALVRVFIRNSIRSWNSEPIVLQYMVGDSRNPNVEVKTLMKFNEVIEGIYYQDCRVELPSGQGTKDLLVVDRFQYITKERGYAERKNATNVLSINRIILGPRSGVDLSPVEMVKNYALAQNPLVSPSGVKSILINLIVGDRYFSKEYYIWRKRAARFSRLNWIGISVSSAIGLVLYALNPSSVAILSVGISLVAAWRARNFLPKSKQTQHRSMRRVHVMGMTESPYYISYRDFDVNPRREKKLSEMVKIIDKFGGESIPVLVSTPIADVVEEYGPERAVDIINQYSRFGENLPQVQLRKRSINLPAVSYNEFMQEVVDTPMLDLNIPDLNESFMRFTDEAYPTGSGKEVRCSTCNFKQEDWLMFCQNCTSKLSDSPSVR